MKSKIRKIVVEDVELNWSIKSISPNYICLRIWKEGNRSLPWAQVKFRFDDPWLNYGELIIYEGDHEEVFQLKPVTPKVVSQITKKILGLYGAPGEFKSSHNFSLEKEGELVEIENALSLTKESEGSHGDI